LAKSAHRRAARYGPRVAVDRPGPGEELNDGAPTTARIAASAILLRDTDAGPEVLLLQRTPEARFMGGAWVFPGGAVHADDGDDDRAPAVAALRETEEEAGLTIDAGELIPFSRWITPAEVKIRFDTWFFLARAPENDEPTVDGSEIVDARWLRPADALEQGRRDELLLVFPTIKHLEELAGFASVDDAVASARARRVMPVQPKVIADGGVARVVMPGEPGYDD
jgi:8-oxo-dGTP pyrophosphatase MutT (NUDIX family)